MASLVPQPPALLPPLRLLLLRLLRLLLLLLLRMTLVLLEKHRHAFQHAVRLRPVKQAVLVAGREDEGAPLGVLRQYAVLLVVVLLVDDHSGGLVGGGRGQGSFLN